MIKDVFVTLAKVIKKEFGDTYPIYIDEIKQGLKCPCFFIKCIYAEFDRINTRMTAENNSFVIQFVGKDEDAFDKMDILDRLNATIDILDNKFVAYNKKMEIVDGIIILKCNIRYHLLEIKEEDNMTTLEEIKTKGI